MDTMDRDSIWLREPVISKIRMIPVRGARTIAAKYPAMASSTKLLIYIASSPKNCTPTVAKVPPMNPPSTSSGKKMPPGAPEPKLTAEKMNLPIRINRTVPSITSVLVRYSIKACPLPSSSGAVNPRIPAHTNGMMSFVEVFKNLALL